MYIYFNSRLQFTLWNEQKKQKRNIKIKVRERRTRNQNWGEMYKSALAVQKLNYFIVKVFCLTFLSFFIVFGGQFRASKTYLLHTDRKRENFGRYYNVWHFQTPFNIFKHLIFSFFCHFCQRNSTVMHDVGIQYDVCAWQRL